MAKEPKEPKKPKVISLATRGEFTPPPVAPDPEKPLIDEPAIAALEAALDYMREGRAHGVIIGTINHADGEAIVFTQLPPTMSVPLGGLAMVGVSHILADAVLDLHSFGPAHLESVADGDEDEE